MRRSIPEEFKVLIPLVFLLVLIGSTPACSRNSDLALLDQVSEMVVEHHYDPGLHGLAIA